MLVGSGQWAVGSGQWAVGSGQWAVGSGQWAEIRLSYRQVSHLIGRRVLIVSITTN